LIRLDSCKQFIYKNFFKLAFTRLFLCLFETISYLSFSINWSPILRLIKLFNIQSSLYFLFEYRNIQYLVFIYAYIFFDHEGRGIYKYDLLFIFNYVVIRSFLLYIQIYWKYNKFQGMKPLFFQTFQWKICLQDNHKLENLLFRHARNFLKYHT
jgi:hypothetical protein